MRRIEDKWRQLSKAERDAFMRHAAENHEKNDFTKEHIREVKKELARSHHRDVQAERSRKESAAVLIAKEKATQVLASPRLSSPHLASPVISSPNLMIRSPNLIICFF